MLFDFIECFTTTFLRAHSWLNWVNEDITDVVMSVLFLGPDYNLTTE